MLHLGNILTSLRKPFLVVRNFCVAFSIQGMFWISSLNEDHAELWSLFPLVLFHFLFWHSSYFHFMKKDYPFQMPKVLFFFLLHENVYSWQCCLLAHFSSSVMSDSLQLHGLQHPSLPCPSPTLGACSHSCPSRWWCHSTISSSVIPFSSCLQSFRASGSFPVSQFFASGGQRTGYSVLHGNTDVALTSKKDNVTT